MKKQKVLIVHNYYQVPGGEDTVVENEKKLLIDNGHEVILYTRHNDEIKTRGIIGKMLLPIETIFSIKTYKEIKKIIKELNIDIVHVHNTLPLISASVYYAAKTCKIQVVQTLHNFRLLCPNGLLVKENNICEECISKGLSCSIKNKCYRSSYIQSLTIAVNLKFHRIIGTYKKVDKYIALTEFSKEKFKYVLESTKIYVKPNFVNTQEIIANCDRRYFLYLGRIDRIKGIDLLLKAWHKIDNDELVIVGKGPEDEYVKNFIRDKQINNIKFIGYKNKNEILNIIKGAKALIIPSQCYENFPMTIAEAFSFGVPVIGGNIGNISTIIKDKENGLLFEYNNYEDLVRVVKDVSSDIELINKISNGAKFDFNNKYNEKINYKNLKEIYDE